MGEYLEFLDALHAEDPEAAHARTPRRSGAVDANAPSYLDRPPPGARYSVPTEDDEGMEWSEHWPVFGVDRDDARAYVAWRSERDDRAYRLPSELEYEKAARGADGRWYPWGNTFDATLCKCFGSRPGRPRPEPVEAFPTDVSVYGVRDLAGGVREWCGDADYDGDAGRAPVRGGGWNSIERVVRAANRYGFEVNAVHGYIGFRLAADGPRAAEALRDRSKADQGG